MVRGVAGIVERIEPPAVAEVDRADLAKHHQAFLRDRQEVAEQAVHHVAEHSVRAGHQLAGVGEVACALLMHHDLGVREGGRDVADAARVIEVDVGDDDGGEIGRIHPQLGEGADDEVSGASRPCLDEAGPAAPDEVARRDALVAAHAGVDVEDVVAQVLDDLRHRDSMAARVDVVPSFARDLSAVPSRARKGAAGRRWRHDRPMTPSAQMPADQSSTADVVLVGRLGSRVEVRELPSGDTVTVFTIVVDRARTAGRPASTVKVDAIACQAFRVGVVNRLGRLEPGRWVRAEGTLRRRFWRSGTGLGSAMEVEVSRLQPLA